MARDKKAEKAGKKDEEAGKKDEKAGKKAEKAAEPSAISLMKRIPKSWSKQGFDPIVRQRAPFDKRFKYNPPGFAAQKYFDELNMKVVSPRFFPKRKSYVEFYEALHVVPTSEMIVDIQERHRFDRKLHREAIEQRRWERNRRKAKEEARKKAEWDKKQKDKLIPKRYRPSSSSESSSDGEDVDDFVPSNDDPLLRSDNEDVRKAAVALRNPPYLESWGVRYDSRLPGGYYHVADQHPKPKPKRTAVKV